MIVYVTMQPHLDSSPGSTVYALVLPYRGKWEEVEALPSARGLWRLPTQHPTGELGGPHGAAAHVRSHPLRRRAIATCRPTHADPAPLLAGPT